MYQLRNDKRGTRVITVQRVMDKLWQRTIRRACVRMSAACQRLAGRLTWKTCGNSEEGDEQCSIPRATPASLHAGRRFPPPGCASLLLRHWCCGIQVLNWRDNTSTYGA